MFSPYEVLYVKLTRQADWEKSPGLTLYEEKGDW